MPPVDAIEASIARVLEAQTAAVDTVARTRGEALALGEAAREQVRRLGLLTDRRLHAVRAAFAARAAAQVAALEAETSALDAVQELTAAEIAQVDRAVHATAAALTGVPP